MCVYTVYTVVAVTNRSRRFEFWRRSIIQRERQDAGKGRKKNYFLLSAATSLMESDDDHVVKEIRSAMDACRTRAKQT